jgi:cytochrome c oxidase subunit II
VRRAAIVQLILIGVIVGAAVTAVAIFVDWLPEQASKERERIDFVFWFTTAICISIFAVVAAISIYAGVKFRARPDDDSDGPPIHGHTGVEIAWTAVPAVLVTAIAIVSAVVLAKNGDAGDNPVRVEVTARQFAWSFKYIDEDGLGSTILRLPVDRPAKLTIKALDVIHSFWVPEFGQKQDAVPGVDTSLVITPTKIGSYAIVCTELCGLGHALMRSRVEVMEQPRYEAWLAEQRKARGGGAGQAGKAVFAEQGCGSCHTFTPAGSRASVGPNLDKLAQYARKAGKPLEQFVRQSIVEPNAYVEAGFPPNVMPQTYDQLAGDQLDALVQYLSEGGKKGSK